MRTVLIALVIVAIPRFALAVATTESVAVTRISAPMNLDPALSDEGPNCAPRRD